MATKLMQYQHYITVCCKILLTNEHLNENSNMNLEIIFYLSPQYRMHL